MKTKDAERKETITLRLRPSLIAEMRAVSARHPYRLSVTQIVERGIDLALFDIYENHVLNPETSEGRR